LIIEWVIIGYDATVLGFYFSLENNFEGVLCGSESDGRLVWSRFSKNENWTCILFRNLPRLPIFQHQVWVSDIISVIKISNSSWINITICNVLCTKSPMKQKCYESDLPGIFPEMIYLNWSQIRLNELRVNHCFALAQKLPSPRLPWRVMTPSNLFSSEK
jgi:hypothetical protein